jgi:DNA-binding CsgD family transcriptional regulator
MVFHQRETMSARKSPAPGRSAADLMVLKLPPPPRCPLGATMLSEAAWREIARSLKLSGRELQILRAIFDDHTESAIARELGVSPCTIHTYCERLYRKLVVTDRIRLVLRVMDEFLVLTATPGSVLPSICANRAAGRCPLQPD